MKILAICGSPRRGSTYNVLSYVKELACGKYGADVEIVELKDKNIVSCKGCCVCYEKGEAFCPIKDDITEITGKMRDADGIILASPTYVMNVSSLMKSFIDRLSYICHRSEFYNKEVMCVTTCAGSIGSMGTIKQLKMTAMSWGFHLSAAMSVITGHYTPYKLFGDDKDKVEKNLKKFISSIQKSRYKKPSITALVGFMYRKKSYISAIKKGMDSADLTYWKDNGYLKEGTDYFFDVRKYFLRTFIAKLITFVAIKI